MRNIADGNKIEIQEMDGNLYVNGINNFHLGQTIECGQCFHFERVWDNEYFISAKGRFLHIKQKKDHSLIFYNTDYKTFDEVWYDYFDFGTDYGVIKTKICELDDKLKPAIETMWGIRILNQEFFETMISFIISQNKQIPQIKRIVSDMSMIYGKPAEGADEERRKDAKEFECCIKNKGVFYNFPTAGEIIAAGEEGVRECKTGFRAPYIMDACDKYICGELDENTLMSQSYDEVMGSLKRVHGIGDKVANCIALFGLGKRNAFPIDVWIKRIMEEIYIGHEEDNKTIAKLAKDLYGEYGGYAQQYLFYYGKEMKIGKK